MRRIRTLAYIGLSTMLITACDNTEKKVETKAEKPIEQQQNTMGAAKSHAKDALDDLKKSGKDFAGSVKKDSQELGESVEGAADKAKNAGQNMTDSMRNKTRDLTGSSGASETKKPSVNKNNSAE